MERNIIFICLDTVRKDVFSNVASKLTNFADVRFREARAPSSCTVPSHASIVSGELPESHGVYSYEADMTKIDMDDTLFGLLSNYRTIGVSANPYAGGASNFDTFFDDFVDISLQRRFPSGMDSGVFAQQTDGSGLGHYIGFVKEAVGHESTVASLANGAYGLLHNKLRSTNILPTLFDNGGSLVTDTAKERICDNPSDKPVFAYLNLMETHEPMADTLAFEVNRDVVPRGWSSKALNFDAINAGLEPISMEAVRIYRELYRSSIRYLDELIYSFVLTVQNRLDRKTTFVIFSDHGERLAYEEADRQLGHNMSRLTESLLHVPLIIINSPRAYDTISGDLFSLLSMKSLVESLISGEQFTTPNEQVVAERLASVIPRKFDFDEEVTRKLNRTHRCVYQENKKIVWNGGGDSMEYRIGPACVQRVVESDVEVPNVEESVFQLDVEVADRRFDTVSESISDIDEATYQQLESLGYT